MNNSNYRLDYVTLYFLQCSDITEMIGVFVYTYIGCTITQDIEKLDYDEKSSTSSFSFSYRK